MDGYLRPTAQTAGWGAILIPCIEAPFTPWLPPWKIRPANAVSLPAFFCAPKKK